MTYIKINETLYPATISGKLNDREWDNRESKTITLEIDYATAMALFVEGLAWSIVMDVGDGQEEYDNSEYDVAGPITDNRDGTVSVKMGKRTEREILSELMEVLNNDEGRA